MSLLLACSASAVEITHRTLHHPAPQVEQYFGAGLLPVGNDLLVGSAWDEDEAGALHVFRRVGPTLRFHEDLRPSDPEPLDFFGGISAADGNRVLATALWNDDLGENSGSAYLFEKQAGHWVQTDKLLAWDGDAFHEFGWSGDLEGNWVVVTAIQETTLGGGAGATYIFRRQDGDLLPFQKLTAPDGEEGDHFGWSAALSGNRLAIGVLNDDDLGTDAGAVYVYHYDGTDWGSPLKILPDDGGAGDHFGNTVLLQGDDLYVAAPDYNTNRLSPPDHRVGAVYHFRWSGTAWVQQQRILNPSPDHEDRFGHSLAVTPEKWLAVGAFLDDTMGEDAGAVYLYRRQGSAWLLESTLSPPGLEAGDLFGLSVALGDDFLASSTYLDTATVTEQGTVHIFGLDPFWREQARAIASLCEGGVTVLFPGTPHQMLFLVHEVDPPGCLDIDARFYLGKPMDTGAAVVHAVWDVWTDQPERTVVYDAIWGYPAAAEVQPSLTPNFLGRWSNGRWEFISAAMVPQTRSLLLNRARGVGIFALGDDGAFLYFLPALGGLGAGLLLAGMGAMISRK